MSTVHVVLYHSKIFTSVPYTGKENNAGSLSVCVFFLFCFFHSPVCLCEELRQSSGPPHGWTRGEGPVHGAGSYRAVLGVCLGTHHELSPWDWQRLEDIHIGGSSQLGDHHSPGGGRRWPLCGRGSPRSTTTVWLCVCVRVKGCSHCWGGFSWERVWPKVEGSLLQSSMCFRLSFVEKN